MALKISEEAAVQMPMKNRSESNLSRCDRDLGLFRYH